MKKRMYYVLHCHWSTFLTFSPERERGDDDNDTREKEKKFREEKNEKRKCRQITIHLSFIDSHNVTTTIQDTNENYYQMVREKKKKKMTTERIFSLDYTSIGRERCSNRSSNSTCSKCNTILLPSSIDWLIFFSFPEIIRNITSVYNCCNSLSTTFV